MDNLKNELLIVDDNPENLKVLNEMLKNAGYRVRVAKNGKMALASIESAEPDLVLLDIHMPGMDGFELCKKIKKNKAYENLPIIFLSALDDIFNKVQGFEAGAVDYMTKPFDMEEVKARVRMHLQLKSSLLELSHLKKQLKEKDRKIAELELRLRKG